MSNVLRRSWKRYSLELFIFGMIAALFFTAGRASATEDQGVQFLNQKPEQYVIARPAITTTSTTTTTTTVPKKSVAVTKLSSSTPSLPPANNMSHNEIMAAAGIDEKDWPYVEEILRGENADWNPCKRYGGVVDCNYSGNAAYGIPQSLPGSKMSGAGADWKTNPVTQLRWMDMYCNGDKWGTGAKWRFHNWAEAVAYKRAHGTY